MAAGPAAAQAPVDSSAARSRVPAPAGADSAARVITVPVQSDADSAKARRKAPGPLPWTEQPRVVMLRSLVIPGWGQWHNRAWWKAAGVAGAEGWLGVALLQDRRDLERLLAAANAVPTSDPGYVEAANRYNARLNTFVGRQWLLGGVLTYALVDAYVDAHFRDFDLEFRHDPALPDDLPADPDAPKKGGGARGGGMRLALRWHF